jgi:hypothetical protein
MRSESDGLRYLVMISVDFGGKQSYADTYRYLRPFFVGFIQVGVACFLNFGNFIHVRGL